MITPVLRQIDYMIQMVEGALEKVCRYQKQLEKYSETTTSNQRRADVEAVLDELNEYASEFAQSGELPPARTSGYCLGCGAGWMIGTIP